LCNVPHNVCSNVMHAQLHTSRSRDQCC
jgi:hypothetical protein